MFEWLTDPHVWASFIALSAMEIVLGIDNVVFIAILVSRLPEAQQTLARRLGLILALGMRIGLLFTITWMMGLTRPFFDDQVGDEGFPEAAAAGDPDGMHLDRRNPALGVHRFLSPRIQGQALRVHPILVFS